MSDSTLSLPAPLPLLMSKLEANNAEAQLVSVQSVATVLAQQLAAGTFTDSFLGSTPPPSGGNGPNMVAALFQCAGAGPQSLREVHFRVRNS